MVGSNDNMQLQRKSAPRICITEGGSNPSKRGGKELQPGKGKKMENIAKIRVVADKVLPVVAMCTRFASSIAPSKPTPKPLPVPSMVPIPPVVR